MMLCVPMFVGAQTLTFTDHEPMGNMRTQVTRCFLFTFFIFFCLHKANRVLYICRLRDSFC